MTADLLRDVHGPREGRGMWAAAALLARSALALGFLSAVADRFGLWGPPGSGKVSWGTYGHYLAYVHDLAPYLSGGLLDVAGGLATVAELVVGIALLLGTWIRLSALVGTGILLVFALSMFFFSHPEAPFSASVFAAAGAALLLALAPGGAYVFSLDRTFGIETERGAPATSPADLRR